VFLQKKNMILNNVKAYNFTDRIPPNYLNITTFSFSEVKLTQGLFAEFTLLTTDLNNAQSVKG
jgi:hypothetical protein